MTQKITYCLVTSRWDDEARAFVDEFHKDKLYDLTVKADRKALALDLLNAAVKGYKMKLVTYVDREQTTFASKDLF